jgi:hypothetical protein
MYEEVMGKERIGLGRGREAVLGSDDEVTI